MLRLELFTTDIAGEKVSCVRALMLLKPHLGTKLFTANLDKQRRLGTTGKTLRKELLRELTKSWEGREESCPIVILFSDHLTRTFGDVRTLRHMYDDCCVVLMML